MESQDQNQIQQNPPAVDAGIRLLPDGWLTNYVRYTEDQESPTLFHVWTGLTVLAGAVRRNVYLGRGYYKLYPNLYTILIAPSGRCRKTTAADIGIALLKDIDGVNLIHEKTTPEGLIDQMVQHSFKPDYATLLNKSNGGSPHGTKIEFVTECSAFVYASELAVFIGGVKYTNGLLELLTSLYGGKDNWDYTTKGGGRVPLHNVNISILGASNPEWMAKGFGEDTFGGGFMGRTIYVFQDKSRKKKAFPELSQELASLKTLLLNDLQHISMLKGGFTIEAEAKEYFKEWYEAFEPDYGGRLAGFLERKPEHILKVAMLISLSEGDSLKITLTQIMTAKSLLDDIETHLPQAFAYVGSTNEAKIQQRVVDMLRDGNALTLKDLLKRTRQQIRNRREFMEVMETLEAAGMIKGFTVDDVRYYALTEIYDEMMAGKEQEAKEAKEAQAEENEPIVATTDLEDTDKGAIETDGSDIEE